MYVFHSLATSEFGNFVVFEDVKLLLHPTVKSRSLFRFQNGQYVNNTTVGESHRFRPSREGHRKVWKLEDKNYQIPDCGGTSFTFNNSPAVSRLIQFCTIM